MDYLLWQQWAYSYYSAVLITMAKTYEIVSYCYYHCYMAIEEVSFRKIYW